MTPNGGDPDLDTLKPAKGGAFCDPSAISDGASPALAAQMRRHLSEFIAGLSRGETTLQMPTFGPVNLVRGLGHFHLAPELFLQISGVTEFSFPSGKLTLGPGQAALLPPKLQHAESIQRDASGQPFSNIVIYADGPYFTCHLAHEVQQGKPGVRYLETRHHPQAARILTWLSDASHQASSTEYDLASMQARALVLATVASVMQTLGEENLEVPPESPLISRIRLFVQNQLGDQELSVRRLAEHCGCTADYLSHVFSRSTGEHLIAYITRLRMERAAHLLSETGLSIKEIAWACGFSSAGYFIRTFRETFSETPKVWREHRPLAGMGQSAPY